MNAGFSTQILAQKLAKLNIAQQSIETLSHWCIFHHRHCRQVVETWDSEFHSAPCERRVSLLYLANDIMQNSKKEDNRYISEFLKIIPAALNDVFINGDDFGRHVVRRLVDIWEDRKILGSQGQILKEDFSRRYKELKYKSKKPDGELMEKVVSSYKHMLNAPIDEDTLMRECQVALSFVDNLNKEYGNNSYLVHGLHGTVQQSDLTQPDPLILTWSSDFLGVEVAIRLRHDSSASTRSYSCWRCQQTASSFSFSIALRRIQARLLKHIA